ncbi:hypothetical protein AB0N38_26355 [Micromonospora aurantiaca]|uniref:hypothetical protein n=1 Tax=Micromonospora aurantiaca (nom. illeg.) TaxID=47850 RepID=UPI00344A8AE8
MPRIRSIKPEFFTSEVVAALPLSARLTFIGLWTHVDDNGVTVDNPKLITAALWPLEDDPRETLARTSGDLTSLSTAGLIRRYEVSGRRYLFVTNWDEHQRVSHPSKPRYPRPPEPAASGDADEEQPSRESPEDFVSPPESLVPEQGAGSREQGARNRDSAGASARRTPAQADALFEQFWATYPRHEAKAAARKAWDKAIKRATPEAITAGAARYRNQPGREPQYTAHAATWLNADRWTDEPAPARRAPDRATGANRHIDRRGDNPFANGANATYASQQTRSAS